MGQHRSRNGYDTASQYDAAGRWFWISLYACIYKQDMVVTDYGDSRNIRHSHLGISPSCRLCVIFPFDTELCVRYAIRMQTTGGSIATCIALHCNAGAWELIAPRCTYYDTDGEWLAAMHQTCVVSGRLGACYRDGLKSSWARIESPHIISKVTTETTFDCACGTNMRNPSRPCLCHSLCLLILIWHSAADEWPI